MSIVINDVAPRIHYTAIAAQTVFDVPFEFLNINDVKVYVNEVLQTYNATPQFNTEYNLIGVGTNAVRQVIFGGGGRIAGDLVVIYRDMPVKSPAEFPTEGVFPVEELNDALDEMTAMIQQTEVNVQRRSLTLAPADQPQILNPLPRKAERANKALGFDADGQPIAVEPGSGGGGGGGPGGGDASTLNGQTGSFYLERSNHTGQDQISAIAGLQSALDGKAPLVSPVFVGTPVAPTPAAGDNDASIATTAFVQMTLGDKLSDAPNDAVSYGRRNLAWSPVVPEAPNDSVIYGRANKAWVPVPTSGGGGGGGATIFIDPEPPAAAVIPGSLWWDSDNGGLYILYNDGTSTQWVQCAAPALFDTSLFARKSDLGASVVQTVGDWTPALNFGGVATGITYSARQARWCRSGNQISLWFDITLSAKGSAVGLATIAGLPVSHRAGTIYPGSLSVMLAMAAGSVLSPTLIAMSGSLALYKAASDTATGHSQLSDADFTATSRLLGSVSYEVL